MMDTSIDSKTKSKRWRPFKRRQMKAKEAKEAKESSSNSTKKDLSFETAVSLEDSQQVEIQVKPLVTDDEVNSSTSLQTSKPTEQSSSKPKRRIGRGRWLSFKGNRNQSRETKAKSSRDQSVDSKPDSLPMSEKSERSESSKYQQEPSEKYRPSEEVYRMLSVDTFNLPVEISSESEEEILSVDSFSRSPTEDVSVISVAQLSGSAESDQGLQEDEAFLRTLIEDLSANTTDVTTKKLTPDMQAVLSEKPSSNFQEALRTEEIVGQAEEDVHQQGQAEEDVYQQLETPSILEEDWADFSFDLSSGFSEESRTVIIVDDEKAKEQNKGVVSKGLDDEMTDPSTETTMVKHSSNPVEPATIASMINLSDTSWVDFVTPTSAEKSKDGVTAAAAAAEPESQGSKEAAAAAAAQQTNSKETKPTTTQDKTANSVISTFSGDASANTGDTSSKNYKNTESKTCTTMLADFSLGLVELDSVSNFHLQLSRNAGSLFDTDSVAQKPPLGPRGARETPDSGIKSTLTFESLGIGSGGEANETSGNNSVEGSLFSSLVSTATSGLSKKTEPSADEHASSSRMSSSKAVSPVHSGVTKVPGNRNHDISREESKERGGPNKQEESGDDLSLSQSSILVGETLMEQVAYFLPREGFPGVGLDFLLLKPTEEPKDDDERSGDSIDGIVNSASFDVNWSNFKALEKEAAAEGGPPSTTSSRQSRRSQYERRNSSHNNASPPKQGTTSDRIVPMAPKKARDMQRSSLVEDKDSLVRALFSKDGEGGGDREMDFSENDADTEAEGDQQVETETESETDTETDVELNEVRQGPSDLERDEVNRCLSPTTLDDEEDPLFGDIEEPKSPSRRMTDIYANRIAHGEFLSQRSPRKESSSSSAPQEEAMDMTAGTLQVIGLATATSAPSKKTTGSQQSSVVGDTTDETDTSYTSKELQTYVAQEGRDPRGGGSSRGIRSRRSSTPTMDTLLWDEGQVVADLPAIPGITLMKTLRGGLDSIANNIDCPVYMEDDETASLETMENKEDLDSIASSYDEEELVSELRRVRHRMPASREADEDDTFVGVEELSCCPVQA